MAVSQYDKEHLTPEQQATIQAVTDAANAGNMSWNDAHAAAEAIRSQAAGGGYSGGADGSEYNAYQTDTGTKADPYANSNYHQDAINYAREYAKNASSGNQGDWGAVLDALSKRDEKIAATGNDYGKSSNDILRELYAIYYEPYTKEERPVYTGNPWDSTYGGLANQLFNMNYEDWTQGGQYASLRDRYSNAGRLAMQDTLGQVSSRTGGLASSYATTASQQQYNDYMGQLEEIARQMYDAERGELMENAQLAMNLSDREYNRYMDNLNYQYQLDRDAISDSRYEQEYADSTAATTKADAQNRVNAYLAANGKVADLDADLIAQSGYTQSELAALESYYAAQMVPVSGSGSGGVYTQNTPDGSIYERMYRAGIRTEGDAYAWLVDNGYSATETENLMGHYMNWLDTNGMYRPEKSEYYDAIQKQIDDRLLDDGTTVQDHKGPEWVRSVLLTAAEGGSITWDEMLELMAYYGISYE